MKVTLQFLSDLADNNSLEWMKEHKERYLEAKNEFLAFVQDLIVSISAFDPSVAHLRAEDLMFRLNRDTRFSKDKSPYNASFRAHICSAGRVPIPAGYYVSVKPSSSFLGGGVFATQFPQATTMVRDYMVEHPEQFQRIISDKAFGASFTVEGDKLKNVPRGYNKEHPLAEYLKHKSWDVEYPVTDDELHNIALLSEKFQLMKPLNDYMNEALRDFVMPQR
jgi:uncharacterized protein (TIGR02453 family)